jgi:hypothetical protein
MQMRCPYLLNNGRSANPSKRGVQSKTGVSQPCEYNLLAIRVKLICMFAAALNVGIVWAPNIQDSTHPSKYAHRNKFGKSWVYAVGGFRP